MGRWKLVLWMLKGILPTLRGEVGEGKHGLVGEMEIQVTEDAPGGGVTLAFSKWDNVTGIVSQGVLRGRTESWCLMWWKVKSMGWLAGSGRKYSKNGCSSNTSCIYYFLRLCWSWCQRKGWQCFQNRCQRGGGSSSQRCGRGESLVGWGEIALDLRRKK